MADGTGSAEEKEQQGAGHPPAPAPCPSPPRQRVQLPEDPGLPVDQIIREAMAEGVFDNLPGRGKPLPVDAPADPRAPAFRILRNAGFAPEWVELERAIEDARAEMYAALSEYAAQREAAAADLQALLVQAAAPRPPRRGWLSRLRAGGGSAPERLASRVSAAAEALNAAGQQACRAHLERLHAINRMVDRVNLIHPARGCQHPREDPRRAAAVFFERFPRLLVVARPGTPPVLQHVTWDVPEEWLRPQAPSDEPLPRRACGEVQLDALVEYRRRNRRPGAS